MVKKTNAENPRLKSRFRNREFIRRLCCFVVCVLFLILIPLQSFAQDEEEGTEEIRFFKRGSGSEKIVALTFDDGPKPEFSNEVLGILDRYGVKATFFIVGSEAKLHPDMVFAIYERDHDIGNHTYSHTSARKLSSSQIADEIKKTNITIKEITGKTPKYFRAPGGWYNDVVRSEVKKQGLIDIGWSINSADYVKLSEEYKVEIDFDDLANKVYERVIKKIHPGAVMLFHNGSSQTIRALPRIIEKLKQMDYQFVTISEMMNGGKNYAKNKNY